MALIKPKPAPDLVAPRSGMVKLVPSRGSALTLIKADDLDRSGGVGGWQPLERALAPDATWWKATTNGELSLSCLIDIDETGGPDLERRLDVLYAMGRPAAGADEPPSIRVIGDVDPDTRRKTWKLDNIRLGKETFRADAPALMRQQALTLELSELVIVDPVALVTVRRTRNAAGQRRRRTIRSRQGDTLRAIAVRQLGSSGQYKQLREWNPRLKRVDPDQPLKVNTQIVLR